MKKISIIKKINVSFLRANLVQPFRTALGSHDTLENILFTLELSDGIKGFGEAAIASHITGESLDQTFKNLQMIGKNLVGRDVSDYLRISQILHAKLPHNKSAIAAIETALFDALTKQLKIPLWKFFGEKIKPLTTDITIVIADLQETEDTIKKYWHQGFRKFKVKIGCDFDLDVKRVIAINKLAPHCDMYLDANQGFTAKQILLFLKHVEKAGVRPVLLEQPVPREDWEGLKKVTRSTRIPVCADESVRSLAEAAKIIREKAASVINVKLMKFGMIESREIAHLARANNVDLMIGGMLETSLAMTASAHLACGLNCFKYIDLDTPFFIKGDVERNPYLSNKGVYRLSSIKPGIGIK